MKKPLSLETRWGTWTLALLFVSAACGGSDVESQNQNNASFSAAAGAARALMADTIPGTLWTHRDYELFEGYVRRAEELALDTLPLGRAVAEVGLAMVGTPYTPGTLEVGAPERLVVNLRELDCVTFVENVLALTAFVWTGGAELLGDPAAARERYEGLLLALRYREGTIDGYASRLHYFSEWVSHAVAAGTLGEVAGIPGLVSDDEPIDFMSTHPHAYPALADSAELAGIRYREGVLNAGGPRRFVPQEALADADSFLEDGDVVAATSTVRGLDVAHTGLVVRIAGRAHLLHAPLVGDSVEVSVVPISERIDAIGSQDGAIFARPVPGPFFGGER